MFLVARYRDGDSPSRLFDYIEHLSTSLNNGGGVCEYGGKVYPHRPRVAKRARWENGRDEEPNYAAPSDDELTRRLRKLVSGSNLPPVSPDPIIHPMTMGSQQHSATYHEKVAAMAALRAAAPPAQVKPLRTYGTKRWTLPEFEMQEQTDEQRLAKQMRVVIDREHDKQRFRQAEADAIAKADLDYFRARNKEAAAQISVHQQWECAQRQEQEQTRCDRQSFLRRLGSRIDAPMEVGQ